MHPGFAEWVEFQEGTLADDRRRAFQAHLDEGCSACESQRADVARLLEALEGDRLLEPSPAAVRAAHAALRPRTVADLRPGWARGLREALAGLVFDSFARPQAAFAGARSASVARRLRYESGGVELDLLVESEGDVRRITGQLLRLGTPARPMARAPFAVFGAGEFVSEGKTDERGEFSAPVDVPGEVEVRVADGGRLVTFRIPEPFFRADPEEK